MAGRASRRPWRWLVPPVSGIGIGALLGLAVGAGGGFGIEVILASAFAVGVLTGLRFSGATALGLGSLAAVGMYVTLYYVGTSLTGTWQPWELTSSRTAILAICAAAGFLGVLAARVGSRVPAR